MTFEGLPDNVSKTEEPLEDGGNAGFANDYQNDSKILDAALNGYDYAPPVSKPSTTQQQTQYALADKKPPMTLEQRRIHYQNEFGKVDRGEHVRGTTASVYEQREQRFAQNVNRALKDEGIIWDDLESDELDVLAKSSRKAASEGSIFNDADFNRRLDRFVDSVKQRKAKERAEKDQTDRSIAEQRESLNRDKALADVQNDREMFDSTYQDKAAADLKAAKVEIKKQNQINEGEENRIDNSYYTKVYEKESAVNLAELEVRASNADLNLSTAEKRKMTAAITADNEYNKAALNGELSGAEEQFARAGAAFRADPSNEEAAKAWRIQLSKLSSYTESIEIASGGNYQKDQQLLNGAISQYRQVGMSLTGLEESRQDQLSELAESGLDQQEIAIRTAQINKTFDETATGLKDTYTAIKDRMTALSERITSSGNEKLSQWFSGELVSANKYLEIMLDPKSAEEEFKPTTVVAPVAVSERIATESSSPVSDLIATAKKEFAEKESEESKRKIKQMSIKTIKKAISQKGPTKTAFLKWAKSKGLSGDNFKRFDQSAYYDRPGMSNTVTNRDDLINEFAELYYQELQNNQDGVPEGIAPK